MILIKGNILCFFCSCHLEWKKGKNVTQKVVKKKQKKKGKNLYQNFKRKSVKTIGSKPVYL